MDKYAKMAEQIQGPTDLCLGQRN